MGYVLINTTCPYCGDELNHANDLDIHGRLPVWCCGCDEHVEFLSRENFKRKEKP